jgi:hypothetical protein
MSVYQTKKFCWAGPGLTKPDPADPTVIKIQVLDGIINKEDLCHFKSGTSFYCDIRGEIFGVGQDMDLNRIRLACGVEWDAFCEFATVLVERAAGMF